MEAVIQELSTAMLTILEHVSWWANTTGFPHQLSQNMHENHPVLLPFPDEEEGSSIRTKATSLCLIVLIPVCYLCGLSTLVLFLTLIVFINDF